MKSLSKVYRRAADEQLQPWGISELDVEQTEASKGIDTDQILALFRNGNDNSFSEGKNRLSSVLHPAGMGLDLTSWELGEINLQPPPEVEKEWLFVDLPDDSHEDPEKENWNEEANFETESATILNQARAQAEEILLQARTEAHQILLQVQEEVKQEKKKGYQEGSNSAHSEMQQALHAASGLVDEIQKWQSEFMSQAEQTIIEMLKEIAETMFGEGVHLNADALQVNLNRIMENAQRLGDLNIFLNPRDANLLDPSWKEYQFLISGNKVRIIPSEKITPGGCIVKGTTGMVDGRVETQLAAILNTFDELREGTQG